MFQNFMRNAAEMPSESVVSSIVLFMVRTKRLYFENVELIIFTNISIGLYPIISITSPDAAIAATTAIMRVISSVAFEVPVRFVI